MVTHYRNGDPIPNVTDDGTWRTLSTGAYCNYNSDKADAALYGRLYNWYAVDDSRSIAPEGWHVATDDEWKQLEMYLGMSQAEADSEGWRGIDWSPFNQGSLIEPYRRAHKRARPLYPQDILPLYLTLSTIQSAISFRASGDIVSSIFPYSTGEPVSATWNRWLSRGSSSSL